MSDCSPDNTNGDDAINPSPPTDKEKYEYYLGLPSAPVLVARTSTEKWVPLCDTRRNYKRLEVVGEHAIKDLWNDENGPLRQDITGCLENIEWNAIDILRIAYDHPYNSAGQKLNNPVTMLISVKEDSTEFKTALVTVTKCRDILFNHGIRDVHVEMKEGSLVSCFSGPWPTETQLSDTPASTQNIKFVARSLFGETGLKYIFPFSQHIGTQIAADYDLGGGGTKGIYLQGKAKTYALTCRHVALPSNSDTEKKYHSIDYQHDNDGHPVTIVQPSTKEYKDLISNCSKEIDTYNTSVEILSKQHSRPDAENTQETLRCFGERISHLKECISLLDRFETSDSRTLGHLEFSPPIEIGHQASDQKRLRDWALIELDAARFTSGLAQLKNTLPAANDLQRLVSLAAKRGAVPLFTGHHDITLMLESELDNDVHVMKYGQKTKYTLGVSNGVRSVLRHPFPEGQSIQSSEWCIIGEEGKGFSAQGDSGSCVFDLSGRVRGMLTSGIKASGDMCDTTYVTPMEWLLSDITSKGYSVRLA